MARCFPSISKQLRWVDAAALAFAILCSCHSVFGEPPTFEAHRLKVAAVQMRSSSDLATNVQKIIDHLERSAQKGNDVVLFPECALTSYSTETIRLLKKEVIEQGIETVAKACSQHQIAAIVGSATWEGERLYNTAIIIDGKGKVIERYHKIQLAEDWPVGGDHLSLFYLKGIPCSVIICHDERYPELVRLPVLAGAKVVFYLSHESGVRSESKIEPYRAQIQARAVENNVYIVHANAPANEDTTGSHGHSRLIAPDGNILQEASIFKEDILMGSLDLSQASQANARKSMTRGPLIEWYREGVKKVKVIPE